MIVSILQCDNKFFNVLSVQLQMNHEKYETLTLMEELSEIEIQLQVQFPIPISKFLYYGTFLHCFKLCCTFVMEVDC